MHARVGNAPLANSKVLYTRGNGECPPWRNAAYTRVRKAAAAQGRPLALPCDNAVPHVNWCCFVLVRHDCRTRLSYTCPVLPYREQQKAASRGRTWWPVEYDSRVPGYGVWFSARVLSYDKERAALKVRFVEVELSEGRFAYSNYVQGEVSRGRAPAYY